MGSLRNKMISEMLNYERSMNRIVLDRTIEQAKLFNETRSPPSNRDIKFEALIGDLVNKLKQKIQQTTGLIAETQYEDVGTKEFISSMKKKTGEYPKNSGIETGPEFDDISESSHSSDEVNSEDYAASDVDSVEAKLPGKVGEGFGKRMIGMGKVKRELKRGKKDPLKTLKRRKEGGANSEGEADSPLPAKEGREQQQEQLSADQLINKVENGVLGIVSEYNGIISKILEATQPQGRFASKSTTTQTNVQFLGGILRDLAQPLKQLEFELSSSKFPEITKYFNLLNNMVKIVESSPPFQKINADAYKNAPIDFQGTNSAMVLDDPGYEKELRLFARRLINAQKKLISQSSAFLFNMNAVMKTNPDVAEAGLKELDKRQNEIQNTLRKVTEEISLIGQREMTKANKANVLRELRVVTEKAETALLDNIVEKYRAQAAADAVRRAPTQPAPPNLAAARMFADTGAPAPQYASPGRQDKPLRMDPDMRGFNSGYEDDPEFQATMGQLEAENRAEEFGIEDMSREGYLDEIAELQREFLENQEALSDLDDEDEFGMRLGETEADRVQRIMREAGFPASSGPKIRQPKRQLDLGTIMLDTSRRSKKVENKEGAPRRASQRTGAPNLSIPRSLGELGVRPPEVARAIVPYQSPQSTRGQILENMSRPELNRLASSLGIKTSKGKGKGSKDHPEIVREIQALRGYGRKSKKDKQEEKEEEKKPKRKSKKDKEGGSGGLATLLSTQEQVQHTRMGRPVSNEDAVRAVEIELANRFQQISNPLHSTPVGKLYPFYEKDPASKYTYPMLLKHQRGKSAPTKNALGADYSLLQGDVGGPTKYPKQPKKPRTRKIVTKEEATQNIIEGRGRKKNKKALHKLNFNDEKNEMFD